MKRSMICAVALVATIYLGGRPAFAQHVHGGGASHGATSTHGKSAKNDPSSGGTKASEALTDNTKLASKLQSLLGPGVVGPKGTFPTIQDAAQGYKNLGQFVASVHVSHNLGIPFTDLRAKMMAGDSLGQAVEDLKPSANTKQEVKQAQAQAKKDLKESSS